MQPALQQERYGIVNEAKERLSHRHGPDPLRKDYLASHMREPHPYGFSALSASQLLKWNADELRREHDRMHVGERCEKCGEPKDDAGSHMPAEIGGGCIAMEDYRRSRAVECPYCEHTHSASEVSICEGRDLIERIADEVPGDMR